MKKDQQSPPSETPGGFGIPADTYGLKDSAPSSPSAFAQSKSKNSEKSHGDNYGLDRNASSGRETSSEDQKAKDQKAKDALPHSKKVRGTLANSSGKEVNKSMLGDPTSLKSETSETKLERDVESGVGGGKSKL